MRIIIIPESPKDADDADDGKNRGNNNEKPNPKTELSSKKGFTLQKKQGILVLQFIEIHLTM